MANVETIRPRLSRKRLLGPRDIMREPLGDRGPCPPWGVLVRAYADHMAGMTVRTAAQKHGVTTDQLNRLTTGQ